jgi:hypothetical protein
MAEAKNTTSPSIIDRRALLAGGGALLVAPKAPPRGASAPERPDPVLALWQDWRKLYAEAEIHCRRWQQVESLLFRTVGFPSVRVDVPGGESFQAQDHRSIEDLLGRAPETRARRNRLHAKLRAHRRRWEAAAAALRLDELDRRQEAAYREAEAMVGPLFEAPAGTLAGVAAKLTLVLRLGEPSPRAPEFPWPQLRSALADLQRLAKLPAAEAEAADS